MFIVCEKANHLAVHAHCDTLEGAQRWIADNVPVYVLRGFFMDTKLTANSFTVREA